MNNLNSILIEGNLTKDPVFNETPKGTAVCKFPIATNRYYRQDEEIQNEVSYFDIETWARLAEVCSDHLAKGRGVRVVGRLKQDRWNDSDGIAKSRIKIVAEHVEFKPASKQGMKDSESGMPENNGTEEADNNSAEAQKEAVETKAV
eukprot:Anaeramoba_ignava/a223880_59.p1 GENE.a223880_59~~a223880_59.p1  ORF type:complete len:147 (+),score=20.17 a223880_59:38-478(+)